MSKTITLQISDDLYDQMRGAAQAGDTSLESVAVEMLIMLFQGSAQLDVDNLLTHLAYLSDDQLWAVVNRRLTKQQSDRLSTLREAAQENLLNAEEETELDDLLARVDRNMLLRSEAYLLLQQRGYEIPPLKQSA